MILLRKKIIASWAIGVTKYVIIKLKQCKRSIKRVDVTGWRNTKPKPGGSGLPEELSSCDCSMLCRALILRKDLEAGVPPG